MSSSDPSRPDASRNGPWRSRLGRLIPAQLVSANPGPTRLGLARMAGLGRRQLIVFAILSAIINGMVTAAVGTWLAQSYASYQRKNEAVQRIADLVYERRIRARMAASAIRRKAEPEEIRYRKRAYDEAFVEWNKKVQHNIFRIRDISGEAGVTRLETQFQDLLVPALAEIDRCLTKAYDAEIKGGGEAAAILSACRMDDLHQFVLDCGASFTNELDRLMRFSLVSLWGPGADARDKSIARVDRYCGNMPRPPGPPTHPVPAAPPGPPGVPGASSAGASAAGASAATAAGPPPAEPAAPGDPAPTTATGDPR